MKVVVVVLVVVAAAAAASAVALNFKCESDYRQAFIFNGLCHYVF